MMSPLHLNGQQEREEEEEGVAGVSVGGKTDVGG